MYQLLSLSPLLMGRLMLIKDHGPCRGSGYGDNLCIPSCIQGQPRENALARKRRYHISRCSSFTDPRPWQNSSFCPIRLCLGLREALSLYCNPSVNYAQEEKKEFLLGKGTAFLAVCVRVCGRDMESKRMFCVGDGRVLHFW